VRTPSSYSRSEAAGDGARAQLDDEGARLREALDERRHLELELGRRARRV